MRIQKSPQRQPTLEALESRQMLSVSVAEGVMRANVRPRIASVAATPGSVTKGQTFALVAAGATDADGTVAKVEFYQDTNGNGLFEKNIDTQVGLDGSPKKGWNAYVDTTGMTPGAYTFFARSRDNLGEVSKPAATQVRIGVTAVNVRPVIGGLTASSNPVAPGDSFALVASNVSDPDGTVAKVEFYEDTNHDSLFEKDIDQQVGLDGSPGKGWNAYVDTTGFAAGTYSYFARSRDNLGEVSKPAIIQVQVQKGVNLLGQWNGTATFTKGDTGTQSLRMNVTSQDDQKSFAGGLTQQDSFAFNAVIGKNNKVTMTFSSGSTGSAVSTLDLVNMTLKGTFDVTNSDGHFAGSFSLTKV